MNDQIHLILAEIDCILAMLSEHRRSKESLDVQGQQLRALFKEKVKMAVLLKSMEAEEKAIKAASVKTAS